jgi:hypothetical protein
MTLLAAGPMSRPVPMEDRITISTASRVSGARVDRPPATTPTSAVTGNLNELGTRARLLVAFEPPGNYGTSTGTGPGARPCDHEIRRDGGFGGKPTIPERVMGKLALFPLSLLV